ncbi:MAG: Hsp20/alpha crystallin family protein [Alphaproteobacteria bacterium]|nr:Hsp20/alpha crystallin family protein [Alphaproteobacteria bacterium]
MAKSDDQPVHIRKPDRARPPGTAGEVIATRFENIAAELAKAQGAQDGQPYHVDISEPGQSYEVRIAIDADAAKVEVGDGLINVQGLMGPDGETKRSFTVPGDLEADLVETRIDNGSLVIVLPRTAETMRAVRQLEHRSRQYFEK